MSSIWSYGKVGTVDSRNDGGGNWDVASILQTSKSVKYGIRRHKQTFTVCLHRRLGADELLLVPAVGEWNPEPPCVCLRQSNGHRYRGHPFISTRIDVIRATSDTSNITVSSVFWIIYYPSDDASGN